MPNNNWHNGPKRRGSKRSAPLRSGLERSGCLVCVGGWMELADGTVKRCELCSGGVKTRQEKQKCRRCAGAGVKEIGPDAYGKCARCDGSGVEPDLPEGADDSLMPMPDTRKWWNG